MSIIIVFPFTQNEEENHYSGWLAKPALVSSTGSKKEQTENAQEKAPTTEPTTTLPSTGD